MQAAVEDPGTLWEHEAEDISVVTLRQEWTRRYEPKDNLDIKARIHFWWTKATKNSLENQGLLCTLSKRREGERADSHVAGVKGIKTRDTHSLSYSTQAAIRKSWLRKKKKNWYKVFWFILFHSLLTCLYFLILDQPPLSTQWKNSSSFKGTDIKKTSPSKHQMIYPIYQPLPGI